MQSEHLSLALLAAYFSVVWGLRSALHKRWTGSAGWRFPRRSAGAAAWVSFALFAVGLWLTIAAPFFQLRGWTAPLLSPGWIGGRAFALGLYTSGLVATFAAQLSMGRSWRIGVDPNERTALVTHGPYRAVRNPIYAALLVTLAGLALLVPNPLALGGLAACWLGIEVLVRRVEEPHLERLHGERYRAWAARAGRFVPWIGRRPDLRRGS